MELLLGPGGLGGQTVADALHEQGLTSSKASRVTVVRAAKATAEADGKPNHCVRGYPKKPLTQQTKTASPAYAQRNQRRS